MMATIQLRDYYDALVARRKIEAARKRRRARIAETVLFVLTMAPLPVVVVALLWGAASWALGL